MKEHYIIGIMETIDPSNVGVSITDIHDHLKPEWGFYEIQIVLNNLIKQKHIIKTRFNKNEFSDIQQETFRRSD